MTPKIKGILDRLVQDPELKKYPHSYNPIIIDRAETEIMKAVEEMLPRKCDTFGCSGDPIGAERIGWNDCLAEIKMRLKGE